jgi:stage V sporulation protein R
MSESIGSYIPRVEALGQSLGLDYHPVDFQEVPPSFMMEVAVYGLPVRMPHWSFGVRWIYQMVQHRMGHSRIFEVVFPGNPNRAYLVNSNTLTENVLVTAHVLGHADFSKNNLLFVRSQQQAGYHIVEQAASHARQIEQAAEAHGQARVEAVLDAALALEQHIDSHQPLNRPDYSASPAPAPRRTSTDPFQSRFGDLPGEADDPPGPREAATEAPLPPHPETDLLWFIARHAPHMEDWERDVFLAVREESFYFQPVFNCQIMNEGWACHWHARILREADFLSSEMYVDAMKTHSDVVRPYAGDKQVALSINPYHLGYQMWDRIVEEGGLERAREIMRTEDDFSFVRNYLDADLAGSLDLFVFNAKRNGEVRVTESNLHELHEAILAPKFNFGAPHVLVDELRTDGTLILRQDYENDGRGLDLARGRRVLDYVAQVWRRPVELMTINGKGKAECLRPTATEAD